MFNTVPRPHLLQGYDGLIRRIDKTPCRWCVDELKRKQGAKLLSPSWQCRDSQNSLLIHRGSNRASKTTFQPWRQHSLVTSWPHTHSLDWLKRQPSITHYNVINQSTMLLTKNKNKKMIAFHYTSVPMTIINLNPNLQQLQHCSKGRGCFCINL